MAWRHRLSNINPETGTGDCAFCGPNTPLRWRKTRNRWVCRNQDPRKNHANKKGWLEIRDELTFKQEGKCKICGRECELVLDHCHKTGKVREALCRQCNSGLGMFQEDPEILMLASSYLRKHQSKD